MDNQSDNKTAHAKFAFAAPLLSFVTAVLSLIMVRLPQIRDRLGGMDNQYLVLILLQILVFVLPAIFFCKLRGAGYALKLPVHLPKPDRIGFGVLALLVIVFGNALIKIAFCSLSGSFENAYILDIYSHVSQANLSTVQDSLFSILTFAIVPAVVTEFIFRGVLVCEYTQGKYGPFCTVLMTAALYALQSFSFYTLPTMFFTGIMLGITVYFTNSVFYCMLLSAVNSCIELISENYLIHIAKQNTILLVFLIATLFLVALLFLIREAERILYNEGIRAIETPDNLKSDYPLYVSLQRCALSPSFLLCVATFVVGAVL